MSKLYRKYLKLKTEDKNKAYLFKNGNFYIFLGDDALFMSEELCLKLTKFSKSSFKCGFPVNQLPKYEKFIKLLNCDYKIVLSATDLIITEIKELADITPEVALTKLKEYKMLLANEES